ncbi:MAG: hypothetical protein V3V78_04225 [Candidatus Woesearchaeota archaeon]
MKNKNLEQKLEEIKELKKGLKATKTFEYTEIKGGMEPHPHSNSGHPMSYCEWEETFTDTIEDQEVRDKTKQQLIDIMTHSRWCSTSYRAARVLGKSDTEVNIYFHQWVGNLGGQLEWEMTIKRDGPLLIEKGAEYNPEKARTDLKKLYGMKDLPKLFANKVAECLGYSKLRRAFRFLEVEL